MTKYFHHQGHWLDATQLHSLFNQVIIWIDKDRRPHRIEDMPTRYLTNMYWFVLRNYYRMYEFVNSSLYEDLEPPGLGQEHVVLKPLPLNPFETPFLCAVRDELETRETIDQVT